MDNKNFNEVLKAREAAEQESKANEDSGYMALDDTQRVKVLSPGRLVFNRFKRTNTAKLYRANKEEVIQHLASAAELERSADDLGRYGLGMKSAAPSVRLLISES